MNLKNILICTVGGSHQPIVTAIREMKPEHIIFICSARDPGTGKPGSDVLVLGKSLVIKARAEDEKPTLPNIPAQTGLVDNSFDVAIVPADDLDAAVAVIRQKLSDIADRFPNARIVADYTGGTKTMTAALVTAVLETDDTDLQLVTGNRADLIKVRDGTEASVPANIDAVRLNRSMAPYLSAWKRHAYNEAVYGLSAIRTPRNTALRNRLSRARDLSRAFAAWDRFDHVDALRFLDIYSPIIGRDLGEHLAALKMLVTESPQQEPMRLFDLWRNAERRAAQGRYDDAVARVYRLIEWTAQWLLRSRCEIDTANIPPEKIPADVDIPANRDGKYQAGLFAAWMLVGKMTSGPARAFAADKLPALLGHIQTRNHSILAHGFTPISRDAWNEFRAWLEEDFLPMLIEETKTSRIHTMPPQLPDHYLWEDL